MSLGKGYMLSKSMKQKLNMHSYTEGQLVGDNYMIGYVLWGEYFIKSQRYNVQSHVLFQDNKSTMHLENNGLMSSGKRTKHIKARYFLILDKIEKRKLEIQCCPTDHNMG